MAIVEFTIVPLGTKDTSLSKYVADCHKVLEGEENVKYQLTPMGTIIQGDLDLILDIIRRMHEIPFKNGALRVSTSIKIDDRRDKNSTMEGKIKSVKEKL
ncbi:MTH1187 family thiamine-binding protein [Paramaledivibacter caminithermalis]|jgi:uncharacterized protein (TIGR00106 family)|uniref:Uncharacterized protein, MTH1187 family n=1 Tax=Paramaledivibacter caminithermalis (strain DSM 15212 / CIP 107654 / DViRD3) TaxID=1121301 RepID=A0A1M6RLL5_PARC5|nr:MTH1187 family thiamine-binding protein [Paramaledivibacter caminithermalis]SHK33316.1 uncharacterized protein, MTH1187 family [Paramaledivibacter caminithermalis DSM 15212]